VVNALSEWLKLRIWRNGQAHFMEFRDGVAVEPLEVTGETDKPRHRGALPRVEGDLRPHRVPLRDPRQAPARALVPEQRLKIELIDQRTGKSENFAHAGGVSGFVEYMNGRRRSCTPTCSTPSARSPRHHGRGGDAVERLYGESGPVLHQQHPQRDGGTHLTGLRTAMTRTINNYIEKEEIAKKAKVETTGDDMREGLTCVLSVKVPEPKFSSQTKDKLVSSEVGPVVQESSARSSPSS
jgi:DNA gyrase subunit B